MALWFVRGDFGRFRNFACQTACGRTDITKTDRHGGNCSQGSVVGGPHRCCGHRLCCSPPRWSIAFPKIHPVRLIDKILDRLDGQGTRVWLRPWPEPPIHPKILIEVIQQLAQAGVAKVLIMDSASPTGVRMATVRNGCRRSEKNDRLACCSCLVLFRVI